MFSKLILIAAVASTASLASAITYNLDTFTNAAPVGDTRLLGSATASSVTVDSVNSLVRLQTQSTPVGFQLPVGVTGNQEKAAPFFYAGTLGTSLGTLADLGRGGLTFDWQHVSGTDVAPIPAMRLLIQGVNGSSSNYAELVWESSYQPQYTAPNPGFPVGGSVNDQDAGSGFFWVRFNGQNYAQGDNGLLQNITLSQWASGAQFDAANNWPTFSDSSQVLGLQAAIGSVAGNFDGYVGDINASFVAVPEPTSLALLALGGLTLARRRR